ncbi:MAG: oligosaccharide flippase family protein [Gemmatimonadaceae bacterium]|nr:oligosaccharide flippase family protein [Gemmatimonadaceae bacterium]
MDETSRVAPERTATPPRAGRLVRGMAWMAVLRWSAQLVSWSATLIVARVLTPGDYGLAGMAMIYATLAAIAIDCGLASVVVSYGELRDEAIRQLHAVALSLGIVGAIATVAAAPLVARFFGHQEIIALLQLVAVTILSDASRTVPVARLSKSLRYRDVATVDMIKSVAGSGVVLASALAGMREWSLPLGLCAGSLAATAYTYVRFALRPAAPARAVLRGPMTFGVQNWVARFAWYAYSNAGFWIVGRLLGPAALGQYNLAWTIASLPGDKLVTIITGAADPFFAAIRSDQHGLRSYLLRLTEAITLIVLLPLLGLLLVADLAIPLVLGEQWRDAVTPLRFLVLYHGINAPLLLTGSLNVITGGVRFGMIVTSLIAVVLSAGQIVGAKALGVSGVAAAWPLLYPALMLFTVRRVLRATDTPWRSYLSAWRPATVASTGMAVAVLAVRALAHWGTWPRVVELASAVTAGAVVGIAVALRGESFIVQQIVEKVMARLPRRAAPSI